MRGGEVQTIDVSIQHHQLGWPGLGLDLQQGRAVHQRALHRPVGLILLCELPYGGFCHLQARGQAPGPEADVDLPKMPEGKV